MKKEEDTEDIEFDIKKFKTSSIIVIEGLDPAIQISFQLCADSVILLDKDVLFIDCWNIFNPYDILKILRYYNIKSSIEQRKILSRIHIARAFTDYQLEGLIKDLNAAIKEWSPAILIISYLPNLFYENGKRLNGERLFYSLIKHLKSITISSKIVTILTSFGLYYEDQLLASIADRVINIKEIKGKKIKHKTKNIVRINDNGNIIEHVQVPCGQTRFSNFIG